MSDNPSDWDEFMYDELGGEKGVKKVHKFIEDLYAWSGRNG